MKIFFTRTFAVALVLILTATGLWAGGAEEEPTATAEKEMVRNVWGELVEKPQYGGSLPVAVPSIPEQFDPHFAGTAWFARFVWNKMADVDWSLPRDKFPYLTSRYLDMSFAGPELAETWEQPDLTTFIFHIRGGVRWPDEAPMNGRELTAEDIEFTYKRNMGAPAGTHTMFTSTPIASVEATDRNTLVIKTSSPGLDQIMILLGHQPSEWGWVQPPEVIQQKGDMRDWRNVVGTGPFALTDVVPGSSLTVSRNPNYWEIDPIHPDLQNRLPYLDEITLLAIPDAAAKTAAFRSGQVALTGAKHLPRDAVENLRRTNLELVFISVQGAQATTPSMRADRPPYDDIRVRIAMQKAINRAEINRTYYDGEADETLYGFVTTFAEGMFAPYADWPADVKAQYEYDPAEAERLLDEAGYPRGAGGIRFKAGWDVALDAGDDFDLAQLVTSYWDKIGVDVTIEEQPGWAPYYERASQGTHGGMSHGCCRHFNVPPVGEFRPFAGESGQPAMWTGITPIEFQRLRERAMSTTDADDYKSIVKQMDEIYIREMWTLSLPFPAFVAVHQPWLKGYRGERASAWEGFVEPLYLTWVDQELKTQMGH